tara:strand:- start:192 stop:560 length:369 start_codon:yes stop_codon:yes gene_type:complete
MFKIAAAAITGLVMLCVPFGGLLAEGIPDNMQAIQTSKPVMCERTMPLLNRFAEDKDEQLLVQYKEPQHNTGGMVWWNAENQTIHVLEFPPMMKGEWACMIVFGTEVRMDPKGVRKKGETPL